MIEPELLRRLGWEESLISEVTRVAESVRAAASGIHQLSEPRLHQGFTSGSALYFDCPEIDTGRSLTVQSAKGSLKE